MRKVWSERVKHHIRPAYYALFGRGLERFQCPICQYRGPFKDKRVSTRPDIIRKCSKCPSCGSTERHRMMHLVMKETFQASDEACKALLHIAPEHCLRKTLKECFSIYHTADLMQPNVDFQEDLQDLSFKDASYDVVLISRVLNIPPKLNACLHEIRRILKPGGMALIAETYTREQTLDFKPMKKGRSREIGVDFMKTLETVFDRVEFHTSDRFDPSFQLSNRMTFNGAPSDDYPPCVRIPGLGFNEIVAICHRDA